MSLEVKPYYLFTHLGPLSHKWDTPKEGMGEVVVGLRDSDPRSYFELESEP